MNGKVLKGSSGSEKLAETAVDLSGTGHFRVDCQPYRSFHGLTGIFLIFLRGTAENCPIARTGGFRVRATVRRLRFARICKKTPKI